MNAFSFKPQNNLRKKNHYNPYFTDEKPRFREARRLALGLTAGKW